MNSQQAVSHPWKSSEITPVTRDADDLLTTTVYRKPTHIDQYLAHGSHHPLSVKHGIVKCLYNHEAFNQRF